MSGCGSPRTAQKGLIAGFEDQVNTMFIQFFKTIDSQIDISKDLPSDLSQYKFILLPSYFDISSKSDLITNFINNKGGLGVFYAEHTDSSNLQNSFVFQANDFLSKRGLNFVPVSLCLHGIADYTKLTSDFSTLRDLSLVKLIQKFKTLIHQKIQYDQSFSDRVNTLKFHVLACGQYNAPELQSCFRSCIRYLDRTKFKHEDGLMVHNQVQELIAGLALCISENIYKKFWGCPS